MMLPVRGIGSKGIMPDVPSWDLTIEHASVAHNCRVIANRLVSTNGHEYIPVQSIDESLKITGDTANITPYRLGGWNYEGNGVWVIAGFPDAGGGHSLYVYDGTELRESGTGYPDSEFTFNPLNTWLLAHNPANPTQIIETLTGTFSDLPGWDTYIDGATWRADNVVPFGPFLVAGPISAPTRKDFTIAWSDEIPPDIVSTEDIRWDATPTTLAGENVLDPRAGKIVTMLPLGQQLIIYCENAVWSTTFTGGPLVFAFRQLFTDDGILNKDCVVAIDDNTHMVIGHNNIYTHNGASKSFPAEGRVKRFFYNELKSSANTRLHAQRWRNEAIIYYDVAENATTFSRGLVFNYTYNAWTTISLPGIYHMAEAPLPIDFELWNDETGTWDNSIEPWNDTYARGLDVTLMVSPRDKKIFRDGVGTTYDGDAIIAIMRHERMDFDQIIQSKTTDRFMTIRRLYPQIRGKGTIKFNMVGYVTPQPPNAYNASSVEGEGISFNIEGDYKVDKIVHGRYLNLEIRTEQDTPDSIFMLSGIDFDMQPQAHRE